jgi:hypothetical protein
VPPIVHDVLRSAGRPLDPGTRAFMEPRFGHDFGRVRVKPMSTGRVQTKLSLSQPGDFFEQEADRVASQVMRSPQSADAGQPATLATLPAISRWVGNATQVGRQSDEQDPEGATDDEVDEVNILSTKALGSSAPPAPGLTAQIESMRGGGQPLAPDLRNFFESRFGHDFSKVRVHTDARAAQTAQALNARAYTLGRDIAIAPSEYRPDTWAGCLLLAHELTHVVQQSEQVQTLMRACNCPAMGATKPTSDFDTKIRKKLPQLQSGDYCITGAKTEAYNCFAWTVGETFRFLKAGEVDSAYGNKNGIAEFSDFDNLYARIGLKPVIGSKPGNAQVALYADGTTVTHAALKTGVACGGWESKLGPSFRIAHVPSQLEGGSYGNIDRYYVPK